MFEGSNVLLDNAASCREYGVVQCSYCEEHCWLMVSVGHFFNSDLFGRFSSNSIYLIDLLRI